LGFDFEFTILERRLKLMKLIRLTLSLMVVALSLYGSARAEHNTTAIESGKTAAGILADASASTAHAAQPASAAPDEADSKAGARRVLDLLVAENFSQIWEMFNAEMKNGLSVEKMRAVWASVIQNVGSFKKLADSQYARTEGYDVVAMRCEFERGYIVVRVAYDGQKKIGGLYVLPSM
jgi:uncharacterized protein DUF3887